MKYTVNRKMNWAVAAILVGITVVVAADKWPRAQKGIKIYSYPEDQVVPAHGTACFTVVVEPQKTKNPPSLHFQWRKNGNNLINSNNISGATSPSLLISNVQIPDVGFYTCMVRRGSTNGSGVLVGGVEKDAPGARLFVYTGTNTAVSGPYQPGEGTKGCVGDYDGKATMKFPSGSTWVSRPSGKTQGVGTETTGLSSPYGSVIQVVDNALWDTCGVAQVTFPASAPPKKYQFTIYVTNGAPTLGTALTLDVTWLP